MHAQPTAGSIQQQQSTAPEPTRVDHTVLVHVALIIQVGAFVHISSTTTLGPLLWLLLCWRGILVPSLVPSWLLLLVVAPTLLLLLVASLISLLLGRVLPPLLLRLLLLLEALLLLQALLPTALLGVEWCCWRLWASRGSSWCRSRSVGCKALLLCKTCLSGVGVHVASTHLLSTRLLCAASSPLCWWG